MRIHIPVSMYPLYMYYASIYLFREGKKLVSSTMDLFSSCFELPSPRVSSPTNSSTNPSRSLPSSPTNIHKVFIFIINKFIKTITFKPHIAQMFIRYLSLTLSSTNSHPTANLVFIYPYIVVIYLFICMSIRMSVY